MATIFDIDNNDDIKKYVEKYKFDIKDFKDVSFFCDYYETRNSWGHRGHVMGIGLNDLDTKIRYYNRTWECYTYQSLLFRLLDKYATYLTDIDYSKVLILEDNELKDFKELKRSEFLKRYTWCDTGNYRETRKHLIRINEIEK